MMSRRRDSDGFIGGGGGGGSGALRLGGDAASSRRLPRRAGGFLHPVMTVGRRRRAAARTAAAAWTTQRTRRRRGGRVRLPYRRRSCYVIGAHRRELSVPPIAARLRGRSPTTEVRAEDLVDEEAAGAATMTVGGGRGGRQRLDDVGQARSCAVTRRVGRRAHLHARRAVTHTHTTSFHHQCDSK